MPSQWSERALFCRFIFSPPLKKGGGAERCEAEGLAQARQDFRLELVDVEGAFAADFLFVEIT